MKKYLPFLLSLMIVLFAQTALHAQGDWFADDDEEETTEAVDDAAWDIPAGQHPDVLIRVNGEDVGLQDEYTFDKMDTLNIQVRHLAPGSVVSLHLKKGGVMLKKRVFSANQKGQIDLEVRTGNKKVKGSATLYYVPSNGDKRQRDVKINVE